MAEIRALYAATERALREADTLEVARTAIGRQFPDEPGWLIGEMITAALGGDIVLHGEPPEPGSLREKFWTELARGHDGAR